MEPMGIDIISVMILVLLLLLSKFSALIDVA